MQLKKIQTYIASYKAWLKNKSSKTEQHLYKWETQLRWQKNWDLEATDLVGMFDHSLENSKTRRLWNRENYAPKAMMLEFIKMQPHFVVSMFRDLFDEGKAIEGRVDRFIFYCDELLNAYREQHPTSIQTNHYHDYTTISYYLCFEFPDKYAPYNFDVFKNTLSKIGSKEVPTSHDIARHFKVSKTLWQFLKRDEELLKLHQKRLSEQHFTKPSMLLVDDFVHYIQHAQS